MAGPARGAVIPRRVSDEGPRDGDNRGHPGLEIPPRQSLVGMTQTVARDLDMKPNSVHAAKSRVSKAIQAQYEALDDDAA